MLDWLRFSLLDVPALVVTFLFRAYWFFLAALALICFLSTAAALTAWALGWPIPWIR